MKRVCKLSGVVEEVSEDIIITILQRLPSKSNVRFRCVSKNWRKYIAEIYRSRQFAKPYVIGFFCVEARKRSKTRFFFSSTRIPLVIDSLLDESVTFIGGKRVHIVASSNGFLLCNKLRSLQSVYYVFSSATRQPLALPKTQLWMDDPYVGFFCKGDDQGKDVISFTIVRYQIPDLTFRSSISSVTIESFSSETNVWTANKLILDVPVQMYPSRDMISSSSSGVIDGVFGWLDSCGNCGQLILYDSVHKRFWDLCLPRRLDVNNCGCLGSSSGAFYFASSDGTNITVWQLVGNLRSRDADAVWVRKYVTKAATIVLKCPEAFGLGGGSALPIEVQNMVFSPASPHLLYLLVSGKVISCKLTKGTAELVYDLGESWRRTHFFKLFPYEWHQWPRLGSN